MKNRNGKWWRGEIISFEGISMKCSDATTQRRYPRLYSGRPAVFCRAPSGGFNLGRLLPYHRHPLVHSLYPRKKWMGGPPPSPPTPPTTFFRRPESPPSVRHWSRSRFFSLSYYFSFSFPFFFLPLGAARCRFPFYFFQSASSCSHSSTVKLDASHTRLLSPLPVLYCCYYTRRSSLLVDRTNWFIRFHLPGREKKNCDKDLCRACCVCVVVVSVWIVVSVCVCVCGGLCYLELVCVNFDSVVVNEQTPRTSLTKRRHDAKRRAPVDPQWITCCVGLRFCFQLLCNIFDETNEIGILIFPPENESILGVGRVRFVNPRRRSSWLCTSTVIRGWLWWALKLWSPSTALVAKVISPSFWSDNEQKKQNKPKKVIAV